MPYYYYVHCCFCTSQVLIVIALSLISVVVSAWYVDARSNARHFTSRRFRMLLPRMCWKLSDSVFPSNGGDWPLSFCRVFWNVVSVFIGGRFIIWVARHADNQQFSAFISILLPLRCVPRSRLNPHVCSRRRRAKNVLLLNCYLQSQHSPSHRRVIFAQVVRLNPVAHTTAACAGHVCCSRPV